MSSYQANKKVLGERNIRAEKDYIDMPRGRPCRSEIRQNIINLLQYMESGYGYEIHKLYIQHFHPCTRESVYYHLKKGQALGEIEVKDIVSEKGDYSWGPTVEKTYYMLGPKANPREDPDLKRFVETHHRRRKL